MASPVNRTLRMNVMLVVVVVVVMISGISVLASSPSSDSKTSGHGGASQVNFTKKSFPVLDFDYEHVNYPFVIFLWILLASLMKLGKWGCALLLLLSAS